MELNDAALETFLAKVVTDLGATMSTALTVIGEKLGLYKTIARSGPITSDELARNTGTTERYVREWLLNQAAGGYVQYDRESQRYSMTPEQALCLADESSPFYVLGGFQIASSMIIDEPKVADAFKSGRGVDWGEHHPSLFEGTERFFRSSYRGHLLKNWIPALESVGQKLESGAKVADIGCGHGASTILMAQAYPESEFVGFDTHRPSIEWAQRAAAKAGVAHRVSFAVHSATDFPGHGFDFIAFFDCLHDMGDPRGAASHVLGALSDDGTWMIVEPFAGDSIEENLTPVGRVYSATSTMICVPASLAHDGPALGAQAGQHKIEDVVRAGGFTRFRRASETPFNLIYEARP